MSLKRPRSPSPPTCDAAETTTDAGSHIASAAAARAAGVADDAAVLGAPIMTCQMRHDKLPGEFNVTRCVVDGSRIMGLLEGGGRMLLYELGPRCGEGAQSVLFSATDARKLLSDVCVCMRAGGHNR